MTSPFDRLLHLCLLEKFRVFCDVNSTSYGLCPLKDARRLRQEFTVGVTETKLAPPLPPLSKKKKEEDPRLPPQHMENCPNFSSFISNAMRFKSNLL